MCCTPSTLTSCRPIRLSELSAQPAPTAWLRQMVRENEAIARQIAHIIRTENIDTTLDATRLHDEVADWSASDLDATLVRVGEIVLPGRQFILIDEQLCAGTEFLMNRRPLPFLERDNQFWGLPKDDETAIHELERMRHDGAWGVVFLWPAFWWLDHYSGLRQYLRERYRCVLQDQQVVMFDLSAERVDSLNGPDHRPIT
jgi:hypothetical protein